MRRLLAFVFGLLACAGLQAQGDASTVVVRPKEIFTVLNNPGIGFTTFQRFNGDALNPLNTNNGAGWTEGLPIVYQPFSGKLTNKDYPATRIAYFRVDWAFVEPKPGEYNWAMIDKALKTAAERGQTLMFRVAPFEEGAQDVPAWFRALVGKEKTELSPGWRFDPEDPRYLQYFGALVRALGERYDGHPDLELVDIAILGLWGEGEGTHLLSDKTRVALIYAYLDAFKKTHLNFQPINGDAPDPGLAVRGTPIAAYWPDGSHNGVGPHMRHVGYRMDCIGDMTTELWPKQGWSHMLDIYPKEIARSGMAEAWKKAPISMEICWVFDTWLGRLKYDLKTVQAIFDQALKWHVSSFNAKSSPVPKVLQPLVDQWLLKMGYRLVLRKFEYPAVVTQQGKLPVLALMENVGVAPLYKDFKFAVRLKGAQRALVLPTSADPRQWLPGDNVHLQDLFIPHNLPAGSYAVEVAIVSPDSLQPRVLLAIEGADSEGWYTMGKVEVQRAP